MTHPSPDPRVVLLKAEKIKDTLLKAINMLQIERYFINQKIFIKPNLSLAKPSSTGATTSIEVVEELIKICKDGGSIVSVGDGPTLGLNAEEVFEAIGFKKLCKKYGVKLLNLNSEKPVEVEVENTFFKKMKIASPILEADVLLNTPCIKTHIHTKMSASVKNLKGALLPSDKKRLHRENLIEGVAELPLFFKALPLTQIVFVDGIIGHQGLGPMSGEPIEVGVILCGRETVCVDEVVAKIMKYKVEDIPFLLRAKELLNTPSPIVLGERIEDVCKEFKKPPERLEEVFEGVKIYDRGACSACIGTVTVALKRMKEEGELIKIKEKFGTLFLLLGADMEGEFLGVGNCAGRKAAIPGCPPQGFLVRDYLRALIGLSPLHGKLEEYIDTL